MNAPTSAALLLASAIALAACGSPPADKPARPADTSTPAPFTTTPAPPAATRSDASDVTAIRTIGASKDDASNVGNANFVATLFEDDAVLMPPTAPITTGAARIRSYLASEMTQAATAGYATVVPANSVNVSVSGDLGVRSGRYETTDDSGATVDTGKWLEVWRKADGQWRINMNIWNSDSLPLIPGSPDEEEDTGE